jgi:distribution and morphology protein 10
MVAAISDPPSNIPAEMRGRNANVSNIMLSLQHDVGKWCTEYNYSAEDGMWGVRFLHNFGRLGIPPDPSEEVSSRVKVKRVDEEDAVEGGLRGRVSIGAELYFSAKEKSAGGTSSNLFQEPHVNKPSSSFNGNSVYDSPRCNANLCPASPDVRFTTTQFVTNISAPNDSHLPF